jgi:hypothetical protein
MSRKTLCSPAASIWTEAASLDGPEAEGDVGSEDKRRTGNKSSRVRMVTALVVIRRASETTGRTTSPFYGVKTGKRPGRGVAW